MRHLALHFLALEAKAQGDVEQWYSATRREQPRELLPRLVESINDAEHFYSLRPDNNDNSTAVLEIHDMKRNDARRLPFNQPTGSQSAALGPIIKRTYTKTRPGPSMKIQKTTLASFESIARQNEPWSTYFGEAHDCFTRPRLHDAISGRLVDANDGAFAEAINVIPDKTTVLLAFQDSQGNLPGDVPAYGNYLMSVLASTKYTTLKASMIADQECALCGATTDVYPNAIKGAGINFANVDRAGAFAEMDVVNAWKHYALCGACADLVYIYSFHLAGDFKTRIAGENTLVLPSFAVGEPGTQKKFVSRFKKWVESVEAGGIASRENSLLKLLADAEAVGELVFLWADFGQRIDNVRGVVSDVLPSRLRQLDEINSAVRNVTCPAFPKRHLDEFQFDLALSFLSAILKRPGGKKAKRENESKRLFDLKRAIVASLYHGRLIDERRFWDEIHTTAQWHLREIIEKRNWEHCLYEGYSGRKNETYLTFAGWIRQLAKLLNYFRNVGVMPMANDIYQPSSPLLKPYFTKDTAIDSQPKAFAFILGVLFGKVMQVQAARGVNVGANALTWLKRLTLTGRDLPELYVKVREKLLAYETEGSSRVREIVQELGGLATKTKTLSELSESDTCYFLLLGQSLATTILPKQSSDSEQGANA